MKWHKKGLVFNPKGKVPWASNSALQPTPIIMKDRIRVYAGFRDHIGISRVGWVDIALNDPMRVIGYSKVPALDIGLPGAFDDNGVVPSAVVQRGNDIYLYYAGYQLGKNVRFLVLGGLAISTDNGNTFVRALNTPILERTSEEFLFRVIHTIFYESGKWRVWYGGGNHFIESKTKSLPVYDIRYMESEDGINFPGKGIVVLGNGADEHRVGRPNVVKLGGKYFMFFGASTPSQPYRLTYAESNDGHSWIRMDTSFSLEYNKGDFDSDMSAYPSVLKVNEKVYMFYNGNDYGINGFGVAELISTNS